MTPNLYGADFPPFETCLEVVYNISNKVRAGFADSSVLPTLLPTGYSSLAFVTTDTFATFT